MTTIINNLNKNTNTDNKTTVGFFIDNKKFFAVEAENNKILGNIPIYFKKGLLPKNIYNNKNEINIINSVNFFKKLREDIKSKKIVFQDIKNIKNQKELIKAAHLAGFSEEKVADWKDNVESLLVPWSNNKDNYSVLFFHNENYKELISLYIIENNKIKNTINYSGDIEENILNIAKELKKVKIKKIFISGDFVNIERLKELFFALKIKSEILNIWHNFFDTNSFIPNVFFNESHVFMKAYSLALPEEKLTEIFSFIYDRNGLLERQKIIENYNRTFLNIHQRNTKNNQAISKLNIKNKLTNNIKHKEKEDIGKKIISKEIKNKKLIQEIKKIEKETEKKSKTQNIPEKNNNQEIQTIVPQKNYLKNIIPIKNIEFTSNLENKEKIFFNFFNSAKKQIENVTATSSPIKKEEKKIEGLSKKSFVFTPKSKIIKEKEEKNKKIVKDNIIVKNIKPYSKIINKNSPFIDVVENTNEKNFKNSLREYFIDLEKTEKKIKLTTETKLKENKQDIQKRILELKNKAKDLKSISSPKKNTKNIENINILSKRISKQEYIKNDLEKKDNNIKTPKKVVKKDILEDLNKIVFDIDKKKDKQKTKKKLPKKNQIKNITKKISKDLEVKFIKLDEEKKDKVNVFKKLTAKDTEPVNLNLNNKKVPDTEDGWIKKNIELKNNSKKEKEGIFSKIKKVFKK